MKSARAAVICILLIGVCGSAPAQTQSCDPGGNGLNNNFLNSNNTQNQTAIGGGNAESYSEGGVASVEVGDTINWSESSSYSTGGTSDSDSISLVNISTTSNYKGRTAPLSAYPAYLPMWNHGGWGTVNAYFPNGPTHNDKAYERTFDPANPDDMHDLKGILTSLSYDGPLHLAAGMLNSISVLFGGPDNFHHGRGFEIANSVIRDRRPDGKPLLVFIDSYIDTDALKEEGYAYVGRISLEADSKRNWDQLYNAAIAETLPWDVDILLLSGGMKGVTMGSSTNFPNASYGYSQTNYSLSLLGSRTKGVTEGKGEAVISASAYRFCPELIERRRIPRSLYERIRKRPQAAAAQPGQTPAAALAPNDKRRVSMSAPAKCTTTGGVQMNSNLFDMAGSSQTIDPVMAR